MMKTAMAHLARAQTGRHSTWAMRSTCPPRSFPRLPSKQTTQGYSAVSALRHAATLNPPRSRAPSATTLEVERKFAPTPVSTQLLTSNAGSPPFKSLVHKGSSEFQDTYYDTPESKLANAGVYVRCRDAAWEAKVRVGGDYTNSAFEEITCVEAISSLLGKLVPDATLDAMHGPQGGGMQELARFVSYRSKFLADDKFTVVLDSTDFGHVVGEVELERVLTAPAVEERGDAAHTGPPGSRAEVIREMDREIDEFMKLYRWAFPAETPVGKLSAYFALKRQG